MFGYCLYIPWLSITFQNCSLSAREINRKQRQILLFVVEVFYKLRLHNTFDIYFGKFSIARLVLPLSRWFVVNVKPNKCSFRVCIQRNNIFKEFGIFIPKGKTTVFARHVNAPMYFTTHPSNLLLWNPEWLNCQSVCGQCGFFALFW